MIITLKLNAEINSNYTNDSIDIANYLGAIFELSLCV